MQNVDELKGFKKHGVTIKGANASQAYGDCVFCGKEGKFYVNPKSLLWDCKSCQKKGNYKTFLKEIHEKNFRDIRAIDLSRLAQNRELPVEAFEGYQIGKSDNEYSLPIWNEKGELQDFRTYRLGKKLMSSHGCNVGLFNVKELAEADKTIPVYLCEGEWDTIALRWLLKLNGKKAVVVGVPGANTFKREWSFYFKDRDVTVLYDNDPAGENGDNIVRERLYACARSLKFMHWTTLTPTGFDIRDLIKTEAVRNKRPKRCLAMIEKLLKPEPRKSVSHQQVAYTVEGAPILSPAKVEPINSSVTLDEVYATFEKWMYAPSRDAIELTIATVLSNNLQGDPIWMFLVAPPGGSKTEILSTLDKCGNVYITSSLTPKALISGSSAKGGHDLSLIPQLDGKTLVIKDFTSILGKREMEKDEIFGILRDAYDGKCGKVFGTGMHRYYASHFSILSGVTPTIYELSSQYSGLGERFLKFFIGDNLAHVEEENIILRSMRNVNKENGMRDEMASIVRDYVMTLDAEMKDPNFVHATVPNEIELEIVALAQFVARMRAIVSRDKYNADMITGRPTSEVGSRLGKQLTKVSIALADANRRKEVNEHDLRIVKKIALDTISQRSEDILRVLFKSCPTVDDSLKTKDVAFRSKYPVSTITRVLNDMYILDIVKKVGISNKAEWTVSEYMRNLLSRATLYTTEEELNRPLHSTLIKKVKIRMRKKNAD